MCHACKGLLTNEVDVDAVYKGSCKGNVDYAG